MGGSKEHLVAGRERLAESNTKEGLSWQNQYHSTLEPHEFGDFTRDRVVAILKNAVGVKSPVFAPIAATLLASVDPQGPSPGNDLIAAAFDVLARSDAAIAQGLLWQAAEHARNARIRVEAIRRSGPIVTPERSVLLRSWATAGFQPIANFQHDQVEINIIKEAALNALGAIKNPTNDDIETIMAALTPPAKQAEFSQLVFNAACEAYWSAGDMASLPKLVSLVSQRWRGDIGASLMALAAKFSAKELKPHAAEVRKAFLESAGDWPNDNVRASRLLTLADSLLTPEFFQDWASRYGGEGLEHGRGRVTLKLLEDSTQLTESVAKGLLVLARWPRNCVAGGPVAQGLTKCVVAGHGRLVAETIVAQTHDGHRQLVESGGVFALYDSVDTAMDSYLRGAFDGSERARATTHGGSDRQWRTGCCRCRRNAGPQYQDEREKRPGTKHKGRSGERSSVK